MVVFSDSASHGLNNLVIVDEEDTNDKATILPICCPAIGDFAPQFPDTGPIHPSCYYYTSKEELVLIDGSITFQEARCLSSSLHSLEAPSPRTTLLSEWIYSGDAKWSKSTPNYGLVTFTPGYWEWLEFGLGAYKAILNEAKIYNAVYASLFTYDRDDRLFQALCEFWNPSTNTLHTHDGETSISLWDLHMIGGLPIYGEFYDEVVPSSEELSGTTSTLPSSCRHLFGAYHRIVKQSCTKQITASEWVKFWFRGDMRYGGPPPRRNQKNPSPPRITYNPCGIIRRREPLAQERVVFDDLNIEEEDRDETYLAALLACWLCKFVFPGGNHAHIRPSVFKVASLMETGRRFSLAIPVLGSIYQGLGRIACSNEPSKCTVAFPVHYVCGWLGYYFTAYWRSRDKVRGEHRVRMVRFAGEKMAKYFSDTEARQHMDGLRLSLLSTLALHENEDFLLSDSGNLSFSWTDYMISLRSCYLTCRQNNDFIVEAYSPHRFARQFGFHQDIPGELVREIVLGGLADVFSLWRSSTLVSTHAKFLIPRQSDRILSLRRYVEWWAKYSRLSLGDPTDADFTKTASDVQVNAPQLTEKKRSAKKDAKPRIAPAKKLRSEISRPSLQLSCEAPKSSPDWGIPFEIKKKSHGTARADNSEGGTRDGDRNWKHIQIGEELHPNSADNYSGKPRLSYSKDISCQVEADKTTFSTSAGPVGDHLSSGVAKSKKTLPQDQVLVLSPPDDLLDVSSIRQRSKQPPRMTTAVADPSELVAVDHINACYRACTDMMWAVLARKLTSDLLHRLSRLEAEANRIIDEIAERGAPTIKPLRRLLNLFFKDANVYDSVYSKVNQKSSNDGESSKALDEIEGRILAAEKARTSLFEDSEGRRQRLADIKFQIKELTAEKKAIAEQLLKDDDRLSEFQNNISDMKEQKSTFDDALTLRQIERSLESSRDELSNFKLFP